MHAPALKIFRRAVSGGSLKPTFSGSGSIRGLTLKDSSPEKRAKLHTTSGADASSRAVTRLAYDNSRSGELWGIPAALCSDTGRNGLGRGASGHALAFNPAIQSASKRDPAA